MNHLKTLIFLLLISACSHTRVFAEKVGFFGVMKEHEKNIELAEFGWKSDIGRKGYVSGSLMLFGHDSKAFDAANLSFGFRTGKKAHAFVGLGAFIGKHEECGDHNGYSDPVCKYDFTSGVYPEIGLQTAIKNIRISAYSRYYFTFDAGNQKYWLYGLNLGYKMK